MWDAFLSHSSQSCEGFGTPKTSFAKRKLDINSIEYQSYIRRDVLGFLDKYAMPSKIPKPKSRRPSASPGPSGKNAGEREKAQRGAKLNPVYLKLERTKEEGAKVPPPKSTRLRTFSVKTKKEGIECKCTKPSLDNKSSPPTPSDSDKVRTELSLYENAPIKCPVGYCELEKKKRDSVKEKSTLHKRVADKDEGTVKCKKKEEEEPLKRHPVLVLTKRRIVKSDELSEHDQETVDLRMRKKLGKSGLYWYGEKGSGIKIQAEPQNFYKLRDQHLEEGTLFEDLCFSACDSSLHFSQNSERQYEWKRPHELCDTPQFFLEGYSKPGVQQGKSRNYWLTVAAANLALYPKLFAQTVPDDQDFEDKYAGIFHFRFWQYGKWIDVPIDDRLPTNKGQLVFSRLTETNEFWKALLEKGYAKLLGSYEALEGGFTCEAMEDFTGGLSEMYEVEEFSPDLFQIMVKAYERASIMGGFIKADPNKPEEETTQGLVKGHLYIITRALCINIERPTYTDKVQLLRLRNLWEHASRWNGAWSDGSWEWSMMSESDREQLGLTFETDGEFWMTFNDFQKNFTRLEICHLNAEFLSEEDLLTDKKKKWQISVLAGEWVRGVTAGGCRNFLDSFWHNPQYRITLTDVDEGDDEGRCTVIVALMQNYRKRMANLSGELLTIGFSIYHLPYPDRSPKPLDLQFFQYNASIARSPTFINIREVSCRFRLLPGMYCIVPSTFDPNEEGEFMLRVFSENKNNMERNDQLIGYCPLDDKVSQMATTDPVPNLPLPEPVVEPTIQKSTSIDKRFNQISGGDHTSFEDQVNTDKVHEMFLKVAGEDKELGWKELKEILDYFMRDELTNSGLSKDICRSLIAMMDTGRSGKLGYEDFKSLWEYLANWKNAWSLYDIEKSGTLSGFELRNVLQSAGYRLNSPVLNALVHRYGSKSGEVTFDDFIKCAAKVRTIIDTFKAKDETETDSVTFSLQEWLECTLYV